ncbi:MAG: hypothetical protein WAV05_06090 [Anaerolineales bacterium]
MTQPSLPSRGIFIPAYLIFHPDLPPATLRTWMQLRYLAWNGWVTPPMTLPELASHLGIHIARLYRHLAQLKDSSTLSWHITGQDKVIISFPEGPVFKPEKDAHTRNHTGVAIFPAEERDTPGTVSYFPTKILGYLSYEDDEEASLYIKENSENMENVGAD